MNQAQRYNKFFAALIGGVMSIAGVEMEEEILSHVAVVATAVLVWLVPNKE